VLWAVFEKVRAELENRGLLTLAGLYYRTARAITESGDQPFSAIIVDEAQDVSIPQLRLLAALGGNRRNSLFSQATWGNASFSSHFPGRNWALKSEAVPLRSRSITVPRTRFLNRRTGC
jgi:hypothetical protein